MNVDASFFTYFWNAGLVVKLVLFTLVSASVMSWSYILQRAFYLKSTRKAASQFEDAFWSGTDLSKLYAELNHHKADPQGLESIFHAGFKEFLRMHQQGGLAAESIMENVKRAMRVAQMREQDKLEKQLPFLATVSSTCPYIGLFGTVWGIMLSLKGLASVQQATIAMVAPGISEALVATAMGLFVAIPAGIAYNRYAVELNQLLNRFDAFQDEFTNILFRQAKLSFARAEMEV